LSTNVKNNKMRIFTAENAEFAEKIFKQKRYIPGLSPLFKMRIPDTF
jgi:hypothetical protein